MVRWYNPLLICANDTHGWGCFVSLHRHYVSQLIVICGLLFRVIVIPRTIRPPPFENNLSTKSKGQVSRMKSETPGLDELTVEGTEAGLAERSCLVYKAGFPILFAVVRP